MIELSETARAFISPSDLTFSWDGCHRCLWLSYKHQLRAPLFMPLVGEISEMQELNCVNKNSADLHPDLPEGKAVDEASPFAIRGKYDLLMEFPDGTHGIIDCKFQARDNDKSAFYSPQLEAYAFALEHPAKGEAKTISHIGLLVWSPVKIRGNSSGNFGMELKCSWYPIKRNPVALQEFIKKVTGEIPPAKPKCDQCNYVANREGIINSL